MAGSGLSRLACMRPQGSSLIAAKKDAKLIEEMNAALKTLKENGTYDKLHVKWFGKSADLTK